MDVDVNDPAQPSAGAELLKSLNIPVCLLLHLTGTLDYISLLGRPTATDPGTWLQDFGTPAHVLTPRIVSRVPGPMSLDSSVLIDVHDRIRNGCHRCQLRDAVFAPIGTPLESEHICDKLPLPPWHMQFNEAALFPRSSRCNVPTGLLCYECRNPQTFCRSKHPSNPYILQPCLHSLPSPSLLPPGSPSLWHDLVIFLLFSHPIVASRFVLSHAHSARYIPPPAWLSTPEPLLAPLDFADWFSHRGPGMRPAPSSLIALHNGSCLIVHLFNHHFGLPTH